MRNLVTMINWHTICIFRMVQLSEWDWPLSPSTQHSQVSMQWEYIWKGLEVYEGLTMWLPSPIPLLIPYQYRKSNLPSLNSIHPCIRGWGQYHCGWGGLWSNTYTNGCQPIYNVLVPCKCKGLVRCCSITILQNSFSAPCHRFSKSTFAYASQESGLISTSTEDWLLSMPYRLFFNFDCQMNVNVYVL